MQRRGFLGFMLAAPAIVAAPSLMRVSTMPIALAEPNPLTFSQIVDAALRDHWATIAESISTHNALLRRIQEWA